jgi:hypothetical protein
MIRELRTTDLLRMLLGAGYLAQDWAQPWDKVGLNIKKGRRFDTATLRMLIDKNAVKYSLLGGGKETRSLASVRERSGPKAWEIHRLSLSLDVEADGVELLEQICPMVAAGGGERVFIRLNISSPIVDIARRAGFVPYLQETLYSKEPPSYWRQGHNDMLESTPYCDPYDIFRLYSECVPSNIKRAYGLTFDEWRDAAEPWGADQINKVYLGDGTVIGWARVICRKNIANQMELMVRPGEESAIWDQMITWGLQQGTTDLPSFVMVPDYQSPLTWTLEKRGFIPTGDYVLMVKSIAIRVKDPTYALAGV